MPRHEGFIQSTVGVAASLRAALTAAAIAAACVAPSHAAYVLSVDALQYPIGVLADNQGQLFVPADAIHGVAAATRFDGDAFVAGGRAGPCDFSLAPGCAREGPEARAVAEIRGDIGRMRLLTTVANSIATETSDAQAIVNMALADVLVATAAGVLQFDLHFDVDLMTDGDGLNQFELKFGVVSLIGTELAGFSFSADSDGHWAIDESFVVAGLLPGDMVGLKVEMFANSECGSSPVSPSCVSFVDASHTATLGVSGSYLSLSGYSYPGNAAAVPEPTSASLLALAVALLGAARRWAHRPG